jgi:hypothetical protein
MLGDKKKSSNRLSGLFSKTSTDTPDNASARTNTTSSQSTNRLTKVRNRLSSATHLAPEYPPPSPPSAPRHVSLTNPTIQPVTPVESSAFFEPLEPPPAFGAPPGSRNASPSRGGPPRSGSRPGTPGADSASEGNLKKLRRRSKLFGAGLVDDGTGNVTQTQDNPLAWIVGHKGKVPYNLAMLLNGEKVRRGSRVASQANVLMHGRRSPNSGTNKAILWSTSFHEHRTRALPSASTHPSTPHRNFSPASSMAAYTVMQALQHHKKAQTGPRGVSRARFMRNRGRLRPIRV